MAPTVDYLATQWRQQVAHGMSCGTRFHPKPLAPDEGGSAVQPRVSMRNNLPPLPGNAVKNFCSRISRFGASHGCARGTVASAKTANNKIFTSLETFHGVACRATP